MNLSYYSGYMQFRQLSKVLDNVRNTFQMNKQWRQVSDCQWPIM